MKSRTRTKPEAPAQPAMTKDGLPMARVRRAPRVMPFLVTGAVLGAVIGLLLSLGRDGGNYTASSATGYFLVLFGALGALCGGVAFVVADRRA